MRIPKKKITRAMQILFVEQGQPTTIDTFLGLEQDLLKSCFRKQVMQCHPDRAAILGKDQTQMHREFRIVLAAYHFLEKALKLKDQIVKDIQYQRSIVNHARMTQSSQSNRSTSVFSKNSSKNCDKEFNNNEIRPTASFQGRSTRFTRQNRTKQTSTNGFWGRKRNSSFVSNGVMPNDDIDQTGYSVAGYIPKKKLKFAQFLYYRGLISWQQLLAAITWQRQNRPKLGQIGLFWEFFREDDIHTILRNQQPHELFGAAALRLNLIDIYKLYALVGYQRRYNMPIGRYFVDNGIISALRLDRLLREFQSHNQNYREFGQIPVNKTFSSRSSSRS